MNTLTLHKGQYLQTITTRLKSSNIHCECCGVTLVKELTIHHVIPRIIGLSFNHAIFLKCPTVVICRKCHDIYEKAANIIKYEYAHDLNLNLSTPKYILNPNNSINVGKVSKAARALLHVNKDWSSSLRAEIYVNTILDYLQSPSYTYSDLLRLSILKQNDTIENKIPNPAYKNLGDEVLLYFTIDEIKLFWINHWKQFTKKQTNRLIIKNKKYNTVLKLVA
jgi:hypothetical protein